MDIRNEAIYCRGDDTEYQAGLGMSFIIDKSLSYCGLFTDEPEDENPVELSLCGSFFTTADMEASM